MRFGGKRKLFDWSPAVWRETEGNSTDIVYTFDVTFLAFERLLSIEH